MMEFFQYAHLPANLQTVSKPFCDLAKWMDENVPPTMQRDVAFQKLLESKDAAVRAALLYQGKISA